jgi:hypothetical protein
MPHGNQAGDGQDVVGDGAIEHPKVGQIEAAAVAGIPPGE